MVTPPNCVLIIAQIILTMRMQWKSLQLPKEKPSVFSRPGTFCADVAMGIAMP